MSIMEENESKQCRICFDSDNPNELISPCLCNGSSAYVHRTCLNNWRSTNTNGRTFKFCNVCQFEYVIQTVINDPKSERERLIKYHFFVFRDVISIILLIQSIIIGLAFLLKRIDRNSEDIKHLFPDSIKGFTVYYLSASILLLALLGLLALIVSCFATDIRRTSGTLTNRCSSNITGSRANGRLGAVGIIILIFAIIGVFVGIILGVIILRKIMKEHTEKLWLRQEADKYIVKDFSGRRNELEQYQGGLSV